MCILFHTRTGARWILQYHHNYTLSFQNQTLWPLLNHSPSSSWQPEKGMVRFGLKLAVYLRWITTIKWGLCPHFASQVHWLTKLSGAFPLWSRIKYAFALDSVVFTAKPFCKKLPRKIMISRDSWAVKMAPIQNKDTLLFQCKQLSTFNKHFRAILFPFLRREKPLVFCGTLQL